MKKSLALAAGLAIHAAFLWIIIENINYAIK